MILAVLDTNVVVQSAIGSPRSASARVLSAYTSGRFEVAYSSDTIEELLEVVTLPSIREMHQLSDDEILELIVTLHARARFGKGEARLSHSLTRDVTDTKFLRLAEETQADYLVTNDRRHLLPLRQYGQTRIVTPARFLRELEAQSDSRESS